MDVEDPTFHSKRARQIIVKGEESEDDAGTARARSANRVVAIKQLRDQFDLEGRQVGIRDSTWLLVATLALAMVVLTWNQARGLDLFARLLVVGGCVTIGVTIVCRNKFTD